MSEVTTEIREGDCREVMANMEEESIHAVVTDPPYALGDGGFMDRDWDEFSDSLAYQRWCQSWAESCLRVLKPGGHLLAFGANTRHHRLFSGVEDAGFEVRDTITYIYGSGYPKGTNVGKDIDNLKDEEREVVDTKTFTQGGGNSLHMREGEERDVEHEYTKPASEEAEKWEGWNSTLKPAAEFVLVARKPLSEGTVAKNILEHGTGAFNVDACRIGDIAREKQRSTGEKISENTSMSGANTKREVVGIKEGRHPPNVVFDEETAEELDGKVGDLDNGSYPSQRNTTGYEGGLSQGETGHRRIETESGGPSRYFYCSKASKAERTINGEVDNDHPTVKPVDLIEWLVKLVTAEEQTVLDPFVGSGTTLMATWNTKRNGIGIERESKHVETARERVEANKVNRTAAGSKPVHDHQSALDW